MQNRKRLIFSSLILTALLFGVVMVNGCGKQAPVAPTITQDAQQAPFGTEQIQSRWGRVYYFSFYDGVYGWVNDGGGSMEFDGSGYEAELIIPEGAVEDWTELTCQGSSYYTENGMVYTFDFGPNGLVFDVPVILRIEADAIEDYDENDQFDGAELVYWNPTTQQWEPQEFEDDSDGDGYYDFQINHFSRYAIGGRSN